MTDNEFSTYVRSLLNESAAAFWTDDDIASYKKVAILGVTSLFWNLLFPFYKTQELVSLAVGENKKDLPSGWHKTVRVEVASTGQPLKPIPDQELSDYYNADSGDPAGYTFEAGKLRVLPDSGSVRTNYIRHWYLPRATTLAGLPDALHPLIAVETVIAGRTKDENVSAHLQGLRDRFEFIARKDLAQYQTQAPFSIPNEYSIDDD